MVPSGDQVADYLSIGGVELKSGFELLREFPEHYWALWAWGHDEYSALVAALPLSAVEEMDIELRYTDGNRRVGKCRVSELTRDTEEHPGARLRWSARVEITSLAGGTHDTR